MSNLRDITDAELPEVTASGTVIVDIWAPWCGPCKMIAPMLDTIAAETPGVTIVKLNADETNLMGELGIRSVPTLLKYTNGVIVDRKIGATTLSDLRAWVNK